MAVFARRLKPMPAAHIAMTSAPAVAPVKTSTQFVPLLAIVIGWVRSGTTTPAPWFRPAAGTLTGFASGVSWTTPWETLVAAAAGRVGGRAGLRDGGQKRRGHEGGCDGGDDTV